MNISCSERPVLDKPWKSAKPTITVFVLHMQWHSQIAILFLTVHTYLLHVRSSELLVPLMYNDTSI